LIAIGLLDKSYNVAIMATSEHNVKGYGMKKNEVHKTLRLPRDVVDKLERAARSDDRTFASLTRLILTAWQPAKRK